MIKYCIAGVEICINKSTDGLECFLDRGQISGVARGVYPGI